MIVSWYKLWPPTLVATSQWKIDENSFCLPSPNSISYIWFDFNRLLLRLHYYNVSVACWKWSPGLTSLSDRRMMREMKTMCQWKYSVTAWNRTQVSFTVVHRHHLWTTQHLPINFDGRGVFTHALLSVNRIRSAR